MGMSRLSRRSLLRGSVGLAAVSALGCPYVANAAAKTATVWWVQGFVKEEDVSFNNMVADYEKQNGNVINHSFIQLTPMMQKIVSAMTSDDIPDAMTHDLAE